MRQLFKHWHPLADQYDQDGDLFVSCDPVDGIRIGSEWWGTYVELDPAEALEVAEALRQAAAIAGHEPPRTWREWWRQLLQS